jgi:hypothetical protein
MYCILLLPTTTTITAYFTARRYVGVVEVGGGEAEADIEVYKGRIRDK